MKARDAAARIDQIEIDLLLTQSLCVCGLLALGDAEKPDDMPQAHWYRRWMDDGGFYQRVQ